MSFVLFLPLIVLLMGLLVYCLERTLITGNQIYCLLFILLYLPIYKNALIFSYQQTGSVILVKVLQYSKELVLIMGLATFIVTRKNIFHLNFRITTLDKLFLVFISLAFLFVLLPIGEATFFNKATYFKNMFLMGLMYFMGRNVRISDSLLIKGLQLLLCMGAIACFVAILEKGFNTHLHSVINMSQFNSHIYDREPTGHYGLSWTFEAQGGKKRFGSIFADPLEFSATCLLLFTASMMMYRTSIIRSNKLIYAISAVMAVISIWLAYSRASMLSFVFMLSYIAILLRYYWLIYVGIAGVIAITGYIIYFAPDETRYFVIDTLTFANSSSLGHLLDWAAAVESIIENPFGIGLAMSGNASGVEGELQVGGENQYLIYGVQLGVIGMLLYIMILAYAIRMSAKAYRRAKNPIDKIIPFCATCVKFGLLLPLFTSNAEIYLFIALISWWMVGRSITIYDNQLTAQTNG
ncbi:MAG: O-antigen ligase family protein [Cytophagales bacterium]|nr:O-antigen ligase family protein [Cytophagales bacterium]